MSTVRTRAPSQRVKRKPFAPFSEMLTWLDEAIARNLRTRVRCNKANRKRGGK